MLNLVASVMVPVLVVFIGILWNSNNRVSEKALELERLLRERDEENKEAIATLQKDLAEYKGIGEVGREKLKNHIYNCVNYKPRIPGE